MAPARPSTVVLDAHDAHELAGFYVRLLGCEVRRVLDIEVDDLEAETARAVAEGARLAACQPQDDVRVLFDPAGHPFCLWVEE